MLCYVNIPIYVSSLSDKPGVSRIQTESRDLPSGSLNLPGNTNKEGKTFYAFYAVLLAELYFEQLFVQSRKVILVMWRLCIPASFECIPLHRARDVGDALDQNVGTF